MFIIANPIVPPILFRRTVNVLAPYVIAGGLLDLVAKAPGGGRVVNVASLSASYSLDFENLQVGRLTVFRPSTPLLSKQPGRNGWPRYLGIDRMFRTRGVCSYACNR